MFESIGARYESEKPCVGVFNEEWILTHTKAVANRQIILSQGNDRRARGSILSVEARDYTRMLRRLPKNKQLVDITVSTQSRRALVEHITVVKDLIC